MVGTRGRLRSGTRVCVRVRVCRRLISIGTICKVLREQIRGAGLREYLIEKTQPKIRECATIIYECDKFWWNCRAAATELSDVKIKTKNSRRDAMRCGAVRCNPDSWCISRKKLLNLSCGRTTRLFADTIARYRFWLLLLNVNTNLESSVWSHLCSPSSHHCRHWRPLLVPVILS